MDATQTGDGEADWHWARWLPHLRSDDGDSFFYAPLSAFAPEAVEGAEVEAGTLLVVSHDRYLLDRLCDRILEVRDGEVRSFDGGYDDWIAAKATV
mgnify:CR=1 FL=1